VPYAIWQVGRAKNFGMTWFEIRIVDNEVAIGDCA